MAAGRRAFELKRGSYIVADSVPSLSQAPGKPPLDELEAVQAALWFRQRLTYQQIAERGRWDGYPENADPRNRKNKAISRVKRGEEILACREYSG